MNYFELHIGDYQKKTSHLSMLEHASYFLMLQSFYATEKPLPKGKALYRIVRAISKRERAAVDSVVDQFWLNTPEGLVNGRADEELANYREFIEKQRAAGKASAQKRGVYLNGIHANSGSTVVQPTLNQRTNQTGNQTSTKSQPPTSHLPPPTTHIKKRHRNTTASATPNDAEPDWLEIFKSHYPERGGAQEWSKALKAANARMREGHTVAEFVEGARRYREFCRITGKIGTEYVKQAATFLGPSKSFLETWNQPATRTDARLTSNLASADEFMRRTEPANETH